MNLMIGLKENCSWATQIGLLGLISEDLELYNFLNST